MDRPRQNDHLGVNKIGKNIRKSPLRQSSLAANANLAAAARPHVYNINRSDFRSIVQQLTGSPSRESLPRPPHNNSPKPPQNTRLHRIRPSPLTQINRRAMAPLQHHHPHCLMRPHPPQQPMMGQGDQFWSNTDVSPISGNMRDLQSSFGDEGPSGNQMQPGHEHRPYMPAQPQPQPQPQQYMPGHVNRPFMPAQPQPYMPGHEHRPYMPAQLQTPSQPYMPGQENQPYMPAQPQPYMPAQPQPQPQPEPYMMHGSQPQMIMQGPLQPSQYPPPPGLVPSPVPRNLPPPQFNGPVPMTPTLPSPRFDQMYNGLPSPRYNSFGQLHSPTSQFALPSPTGYPNMFSPRSPCPLLSPGVQYPQPLTPNFSFSQLVQSGSLGSGSDPPPQPPPSSGLVFPLSPEFFPVPSPRWGDY